MVSLFSNPLTLRSTISGESPSRPEPPRRVLPATQRFAETSRGAMDSIGGPMLDISEEGPGLLTTLARLESFAPRLLRIRSRPLVPPWLMVRIIAAGARPPSDPPLTDAERPALAARNRSSLDILPADIENWPIWKPAFLPKPDGG